MKKFRKVLDGLTTSSPGGTMGSPSCGSAAGTPTSAPTPKEIDVQETLVSENFQLCKIFDKLEGQTRLNDGSGLLFPKSTVRAFKSMD
ncbi:hypothetical protein PAMP_004034 [Pampus punctatissimus]